MNLLITQNSQNLQHTHTFTGTAVNTDEKGGHSHNTNSLKDKDTGLNKTDTGGMSAHSTGTFSVLNYGNGRRKGVLSNVDGSTFTQSSSTDTYSIWGENIACGGGGAYYGMQNTTMTISHTHDMQHVHGTDTKGAHTHSVTAAGSNSNNGGTEVRPVDYTYKIWKRTA